MSAWWSVSPQHILWKCYAVVSVQLLLLLLLAYTNFLLILADTKVIILLINPTTHQTSLQHIISH